MTRPTSSRAEPKPKPKPDSDSGSTSGPGLGELALFGVLSASFVALRFAMNHEYEGAPWDRLIAGTAKLPFGHRVLVPQLARPLVAAGLSASQVFAVTEWIAVMATLAGLRSLLRKWLPPWPAVCAAVGFVPVVGLTFLLPFRWPVFYPWDLPAIAMTVWAIAWGLRRRYGALLVLTAVAALNRESAVLIPAIVLVLHIGTPQRRRDALRWAALMMVAIVVVRFFVGLGWPANKGAPLHWHVSDQWRVLHNLGWLAKPAQALQILGAFCGLPVLWIFVRRRLPAQLRRLEWVMLPSVAALLWVANIYEPRAFGELVAVAYVGVVVGLGCNAHEAAEQAAGGTPDDTAPETWLAHADRWLPWAIATLFAVSVVVIAR